MRRSSKMLTAAAFAGVLAAGVLASGAGASNTGSASDAADGGDTEAVVLERIAPEDRAAGVAALQGLRAETAGLVDSYRLVGTQENDNFLITLSDGGRFVIRSRVRAITPISPPLGCRVDSSMQVSCNPDLIKSLVTRMKRGRDRVEMTPFLRIPALMVGGPGGDRLIAGNGNAILRGKRGPDRLIGNAGRNLLSGGKGRDVIITGPGHNRVRGGPGLDVCVDNRKGNNVFRGCGVIRRR